jgi:sugar lactone lactonase YvrE
MIYRRQFLASAAAATAVRAFAAKDMPTRTVDAKVVFPAPCSKPNGMQATKEGLWVLNQGGDNALYLIDFNGKLKEKLMTDSVNGSGVGFDGTNLWIASTYNCKIIKADRKTGKAIADYATPGCGRVNWPNPRRSPHAKPEPTLAKPAEAPKREPGERPKTGAHGIEYKNGKLYIAVPPAQRIYRIDAAAFKVEHEFATAGDRPHGMGWDGDYLWCADSNANAFHKYNASTGEVIEKIQLTESSPLPHGVTIWNGDLWYCDDVGLICRFKLRG